MSQIFNPPTNVPVGGVIIWFTATPPTNWLLVDGSTFNPATYPELNSVLGGSTLPRLVDKIPVGAGTVSLNSTFGSNTHVHTAPVHHHGVGTHTHGTNSAGGHTHNAHGTASVGILGVLTSALVSPGTHSSDGSHSHTASASTGQTANSTAANTGSQSHIPPVRGVNFIMRAV